MVFCKGLNKVCVSLPSPEDGNIGFPKVRVFLLIRIADVGQSTQAHSFQRIYVANVTICLNARRSVFEYYELQSCRIYNRS
jgi:hypothetical protein